MHAAHAHDTLDRLVGSITFHLVAELFLSLSPVRAEMLFSFGRLRFRWGDRLVERAEMLFSFGRLRFRWGDRLVVGETPW